MIAQIRGRLIQIDSGSVVVDVGGVGFKLGMSAIALAALGPPGAEITLLTSLIVRDDALDLYGFATAAERSLFERLLTVSGVGPRLALSALSSFSADTLQQLIVDEDVKRLTTIPGLGKKTAQRLILDLRGSLVAAEDTVTPSTASPVQAAAQATEALLGMGFTRGEAELALKGYSGQPDDVSESLRYALQRLGGVG